MVRVNPFPWIRRYLQEEVELNQQCPLLFGRPREAIVHWLRANGASAEQVDLLADCLIASGVGRERELSHAVHCSCSHKTEKERSESDVEDALSICDDIDAMADDVPDRGADYAESVRDKAIDIRNTIEETERVTSKQLKALENMRSGLERWLE